MSKKKNPKNAFSFYLDDAMVELRRNGINVRSKQEAVAHVHDKWKNMSEVMKAPYEEKAKEWKLQKNNRPRGGRLDCTGNPIDNRIDMDQVIYDQRKEQRRYLLDRWQSKSRDHVVDDHFFIISFQSFFELPNEEGYQPCEVACVDFSLRTGINREWQAIINPGPIKLGLGAESKIFSDRTHKIPIWGFESARKDYMQLWRELLDFVNPGLKLKVYPPLFCKKTELKKTMFCMDYLAQLAGVSNRLSKIYQWEGLASTLYVHAGIQTPSLNIIEEGSASTMYDYEVDTKCDYHDEIECVYCSLLIVKKCCFWMSDAFSDIFGFKITEDHLPARQPPQYTIINPDEMATDHTKKKFLGAYSTPRIDPNLPLILQKSPITLGYSSETSVDSSSFASRDVRYRPKYHLVQSHLSFGRGTAIPSYEPDRNDDVYESLSIPDTVDDVASSILSDTESDATCQADDEGSEISFASLNRIPRTKPLAGAYKEKMLQKGNETLTGTDDTINSLVLSTGPSTIDNMNEPTMYADPSDVSLTWPSVPTAVPNGRNHGRGRFIGVGRGSFLSQSSESSQ